MQNLWAARTRSCAKHARSKVINNLKTIFELGGVSPANVTASYRLSKVLVRNNSNKQVPVALVNQDLGIQWLRSRENIATAPIKTALDDLIANTEWDQHATLHKRESVPNKRAGENCIHRAFCPLANWQNSSLFFPGTFCHHLARSQCTGQDKSKATRNSPRQSAEVQRKQGKLGCRQASCG